MPARQIRPTRAQDPEYLAELGGVLLAMTDPQRREFLAGLDRDNLEVAERALAARIAVSWRATPVTMGVHFGALKPWRYSLLLGEKFADAVEGRSIRQIWNISPQTGKSVIASQWGPAWALDRYPDRKLILTSYGDDLANRNSYAVRQILREHRSELRVRLQADQQRQDRFTTPQGGGILAAGIGSALTGFGAAGAIVDDPYKNWVEAHSPARRELVFQQYRSVIRTRLTTERAFIIVVHCLTGDTPVLMADGTERSLANVRPDDRVATYDRGLLKSARVVNWANQGPDTVYEVTMRSGRRVRANARHPFRVVQENGVATWVRLESLRAGMKVRSVEALTSVPTDEIVGIVEAGVEDVFDIEVEGTHNFIANGLEVSNTRWHEDDLTARLVKAWQDGTGEEFEVIRIPEVAEAPDLTASDPILRLPDPLGRAPGELLELERFSAGATAARKLAAGTYLWQSMHLQRPSPEEGTEIQRAWFRLDEAMPERFDDALVSWDPKLKDKEAGDYVVGQCWLRTGSDFWLIDQLRGQWNQATTTNAIALMAVRHPDVRRHVIENTGNGPEVMTALRQAMPDYVLDPEMAGQLGMTAEEAAAVQALRRRGLPGLIANTPKGSKSVRMRAHAPLLEAGNVHLNARASWLGAFLDEMCVVGSTMVMTRYGLKRADEVSTADEVLTHRGRFRPVEAVGARLADNVITVQAKGLDALMLTDNHRVLTLPVSSAGSGRDLGEPQWREAGVLRQRQTRLTNRGQYEPTTAAFDTLTVPVLQNDVELVEIDLRAWFDLTSKDGRCYGVDDDGETIRIQAARAQPLRYRQRLDREFGWLCGLWLAEGSWSLGRAEWSFHEDETVLHEKVTSLLADRLGVRTSTFSPGNSRGLKVSASLRRLGAWFKTFGTGAANKRIPWWAWEAPASFHEGMIKGWLDGDGHDGRGTTVSRDLAWGMRLLATRQGIWARFVQREQRDDIVIRGKSTRAQRSWSVDVQPHGAVVGHWTDGDLIGLPIRQLDTRWLPPTTVFDIQVAEDSSFVTTGGIVHNSAFPNGSFDDAVDCASQALSRLSHGTASVASPASAPLPTGGPSVRTGARFGVIPGARVR